MYPVLFTIGNVSVSSFGVFLAMGFLLGMFLVWRLSRAWDLDEEKVLDLSLLTFIGGLIGARVYFAALHLADFAVSPLNLILINKVPGFSFWGGILGGWLTLFFLSRRSRLDFWQLADIASVGLLGGLILSDIGCFLGGCSVGIPSRLFFAATMVGFVGKRWPVQIIEAILLSLALMKIWSKATHFHQRGKIVSLTFISVGIIQLLLEPLKPSHSGGIFSLVFLVLGLTIFYKVTRQNPITHLKSLSVFLVNIITSPESRKKIVQNLGRSWYNQKASINWKLRNLKKVLRRRNVKFS